jgi:hypothetical protein
VLRVTQARARRELATLDGQPVAAWSIEVSAQDASAGIATLSAHRLLIGDADGRVIEDANLIAHDAFVYRAYAEPSGNRRPFDGPLQSFAPHPTGLPDGSFPAPVAANLVVMDSFNQPRDPWLRDDATTTSGNNVEAFADLDGSQTFSPGDIRPEIRSGRVLNDAYDLALSPLATPVQSKAAVVNAFFVTNWMHDWWYDSGFTEATGNAQADNYGRGGAAGDPLVVLSQVGGPNGLRDNAFMVTPADGASPQLHVELWNPGTHATLAAPSGPIRSKAFFGRPDTFELTGDLIEANDAVGSTNDACEAITNDLTGKIAIATFVGTCEPFEMLAHLQAAGASGVVLVDSVHDIPARFSGDGTTAGVEIGKTSGAELLAQLRAGRTIQVTMTAEPNGPERDGDLDNSLIAHEWGHYLHHRLASCGTGQQCLGMSEGWGDFNALLMMLRDGDPREGSYAIAPYANGNATIDAGYFGLRRFPYSIDRSKNDLSFRHISAESELPTETPGNFDDIDPRNNEVHNTGEVWASMLWESFNLLIDAHDVAVARRRMSDYVVAGLLLTPPEATFTEARDAILAAAGALDSDDMLLLAGAFAGRGLGSCAVSPSRDAPSNDGVVESGTLAGKLQAGALRLADDGVSCDHDGILDPGESGLLHVTVVNSGPVAAEHVTVTPTTLDAGVRLGAPVVVPAVAAFGSADVAIPVTLLASAPPGRDLVISIRITAEQVCDRDGISVELRVPAAIDEIANAATVDHVEASFTPWTTTGDAGLWSRQADERGNHVWFGSAPGRVTDSQLVSPVLVASASEPLVVTFSHAYDFDGIGGFVLFDGGVIELSADRGASWTDVTQLRVDPGYTGAIFDGFGNPLAGRPGFGSTSPGFPALHPVTLDFGTLFAGQAVQLRFRIGTDARTAKTGWLIDDIDVRGITNTPFPAVVPESSTCTARRVDPGDDAAGVVVTHAAPAVSLDAFDAACVRDE